MHMFRSVARCAAAAVLAAAAAAGPLAAGPKAPPEMMLGLGWDINDDSDRIGAPAGTVALRGAPFGALAGLQFRPGAALDANRDRDIWIGGGLVVTAPFGADGGWRWILSTMIGYYRQGAGNDLQQDFPVFRAHLELDRRIAPGWRAGIGLGHKSNGGTAGLNPGVDSAYVTISRSFR